MRVVTSDMCLGDTYVIDAWHEQHSISSKFEAFKLASQFLNLRAFMFPLVSIMNASTGECLRREGAAAHPETLDEVYGFWKIAMDSTVVNTPLAFPRTCRVSALV